MAGMKGRSGGPRRNSGGSRPGAGRKPTKARRSKAKAYQTDDPDEFLRAVMRDRHADFKDRMTAALALRDGARVPTPGKKARQVQAAKDVIRPALAPLPVPCRPRLRLVKY